MKRRQPDDVMHHQVGLAAGILLTRRKPVGRAGRLGLERSVASRSPSTSTGRGVSRMTCLPLFRAKVRAPSRAFCNPTTASSHSLLLNRVTDGADRDRSFNLRLV